MKRVLFGAGIFMFSVLSSFLIAAILKGGKKGSETAETQRYFLKNFRILKLFLNLEIEAGGERISNIEHRTSNLEGKRRRQEKSNQIINNLLKLKTAAALLEEGKLKKIPLLPAEVGHRKNEFLLSRKRELFLKYLYAGKKYAEFVRRFDAGPVNNQKTAVEPGIEMQLFLVVSLLKSGGEIRAFNIFKELFATRGLKVFRERLSKKQLSDFLGKLTIEDWYRKFYFLVRNNRYSEYKREKKYANVPPLTRLIDAEFYYVRKQYTRVLKLLAKVNTGRFLNNKKKLIIKIDIRQDNFAGIEKRIDELKKDEEVYLRLLFNSANIFLLKGEVELSLKLFAKYIALEPPGDPLYDKAIWVSAWLHYRRGNKEQAALYFEKGSASREIAYKIANSYWLYRLTGKGAGIIENYPFSYYFTKIAAKRAGQAASALSEGSLGIGKMRTSKNFVNLINGKQSDSMAAVIADLKILFEKGFFVEGIAYINWAKKDAGLSESDRNVLKLLESVFYLRKQDFYRSFISFRQNFPNYTAIVLPRLLGGVYAPVRYREIVARYAGIRRIDEMLLLALIREETMFQADAVSSARANGLMQLLLGTAKQMARGEGIKVRSRWDLYKPEINIRLGSKYFRYLLDKYDGRVYLALAAYNAGDHRVDRWLKEFGAVEEEEFIEMIPFSETRSYVKNIFRNYYYYRYYYKD